jgi:hypothetical protein
MASLIVSTVSDHAPRKPHYKSENFILISPDGQQLVRLEIGVENPPDELSQNVIDSCLLSGAECIRTSTWATAIPSKENCLSTIG